MRENVRIVLVLTVVCAVCAFLLAFVNSVSQAKIEDNARQKIEQAILTLMPAASRIEDTVINGQVIHKLFDAENKHIGYAFLAKGNGYQGAINILVITNPSLDTLEGIEIVDSVETPGLGAKIKDAFFKDQFKQLDIVLEIEATKDVPTKPNQVQSISSATISSKSVVNILNKNIAQIRQALSAQ